MRNTPHSFQVERWEVTSVSDGSARYSWVPGESIFGRITVVGAKELSEGPEVPGMETTTASARIPLGVEIEPDDRLVVIVPSHPMIAGPWKVRSVKANPDHQAVGLGRWE